MTNTLFTRNFTLLIVGQTSSLFANLILRFALSMYVLDQTGSATVFASILAVATIPTILLSPLGGILADRANRRNIMVALDAVTGLSVLCACLLFPVVNDCLLIGILLVVLSVLGAFETPTVQACIPQMLTGDHIIKGNALVNQIAAVSTLTAPLLGSVLYTAFGLKPVLVTSMACFFLTALLECMMKLQYIPYDSRTSLREIIKNDCLISMKFMCRDQPGILHLLLLSAMVRFFVIGTAMVGLPYLVRNILSLPPTYYGVAESAMAIATVLGSVAAGLLMTKQNLTWLSVILAAFGVCLFPAGLAFWLPFGTVFTYVINVISFCGISAATAIFSILAVSVIQQRTPTFLTGKIMAYTATITMCIQPLGQLIYGFLFDRFRHSVALILIGTGLLLCLIGISSTGFFQRLDSEPYGQ